MKVRRSSKIRNICMLSTHGYFDPVPQLGKTDTGGQVIYVLQLAKALSKYGIKVDIYTRWFDASKRQIDPVPGHPDVRVTRVPAGPWGFIPKEEIYSVLPELAKNMTALIGEKNLHYGLFHGHYVDAGVVTLDVAKAFNKPAFFTPHSLGAWKREQMGGDPEEMEKKYKFSLRISEERRILGSVKALTVTTKVQQEKLEQLYGFTSDNVVIITPGVDIHTFRSLEPGEERVKTGLPPRYVFCLGRIDSNKGHDLLLNAFDLVRKTIPDVHMVIGGGSPKPEQIELEVLDKIKNIVDDKDMHSRVRIVGYVPDKLLVPFYQQAELFVLPSIFEPFGMAALEAMACSKPVVASKLGGIRDVISSGENGLLIDPSNAREFADAMTTLLRDQQLANRMGQIACKTIQRHFSWEAIAERHIAFYEKFISI
jgi:mannosylfructose-phosphate synthase